MDLESLVETQDGLITAAQCRDLGIPTAHVKNWVRARLWCAVTRGVYLAEPGPPTSRSLIRAAHLALGPKAVIVLRSAAALHGIQGLEPHQPERVHVSLEGPYSRPRRIGGTAIVPHQFIIRSTDIAEVDGMRVTSIARTIADLLLTARRYEAVSALDHVLNRGELSEEDLLWVYQALAGRRGVKSARKWMEQADGRAESPLETRARLRCADAGVAPDELQALIEDSAGRTIARADMLWHRPRLIGEADGEAVHSLPDAVFRDRERQNALAAAGFAVVRFTWKDTLDPHRIPRIVRAAMRERNRP